MSFAVRGTTVTVSSQPNDVHYSQISNDSIVIVSTCPRYGVKAGMDWWIFRNLGHGFIDRRFGLRGSPTTVETFSVGDKILILVPDPPEFNRVQLRSNYNDALERAASFGKPVHWFIPGTHHELWPIEESIEAVMGCLEAFNGTLELFMNEPWIKPRREMERWLKEKVPNSDSA